MKNIHLASDGQTSPQTPLVSLYWDLQNVYSMQGQANLLLDFASSKGRLDCKRVYYNSQCKNQDSAKDKLKSLSFNCIDVPCPLKNSADNQLIADCIEDVDNHLSPDIVILVSGDGDFAKLVRTLQKLGKKVIIFAQLGNVKQRLKDLVGDDFYFVDKLSELVVNKTQPQTTFVQSQITYEDAIECLIEAIKTASKQGKRTEFGLIGKLMCRSQRFPNYHGASSIRQHDGTTFSCFSEFVAVAVKDGKVRVQTTGKCKELFLIT
jgi:hypothetical protein